MRKIKIICDSTVDLRLEEINKYDLEVVPLLVNFGNESYRDGIDIKTPQLYDMVDQKGELPKTAARNPQCFINVFKKYIDGDYDILCILISSEFSALYQSAYIAASEFESVRIRVIDSRNLSSGIGLTVLKACKMREEGYGLHEIADILEMKVIPNVKAQFVVENLTFLHKGGRCSSTSYYFGKMLHIHPEIVVREGKMMVYRKPRGKMVKAYDELIEMIKSDLPNVDLDHVMITHSLSPQGVEYLYQELKKLIPEDKIMITEAGCVISSHCGRGTIGILYILKY